MKHLFLSFLLIISLSLFGQVNQKYVKKELIKKSWLTKAIFEPGYFVRQKDTVYTDILAFKNRDRMNSFLFCVAKDKNDSIRFFTADEIMEYRVGKLIYKKATSDKETFFIKQIEIGTVSLYERDQIPSDSKFLYYLKKKNQRGYFEICPDEKNFEIYANHESSENSYNNNQSNMGTWIYTKDISERFKLFVTFYFADCEKITNRVRAEIYTINDIPSIVENYNQCFTNN